MAHCCGKIPNPLSSDPCAPPAPACGGKPGAHSEADGGPLAHFSRMIENCLEYARVAHAQGRPIVGILCEFTPREILMAAGAVPVCLCGGTASTIPAAEEDLPSNLCPLIKSTYGYHKLRGNPFLEMASLVVAETTCDGKKKMFELMGLERPMHVLELPQKPADADSMSHWISQLRGLISALEERFAAAVTDEKLRAAIRTMNRERQLKRRLAELMKRDNPPLTGRQLIELKSSISGLDSDFEQYEKTLAFYDDRGADGKDIRARTLLTGVPLAHGAERALELIEDHGGLVVCQENCTGLKPILEDVDEAAADPVLAIAEKYFHLPCSVMTPNKGRLDSLRRLAAEYRCECVVDLVWQACLTYDVESRLVKALCESELHLPYLRIETDYSPSDSARIAVRLEALFETVHARSRR
ncbi:MAG: R-phenyllactate dehydratase beta subunit [candidate division BRC1 bacterium ADurb.BinA364]|nr:MAG: R-phenyllactate dehydratase beta subunit [candidate division BRC1 bacterium ADurb.BinA364]